MTLHTKTMKHAILVFSKAPVAGQVNTRLVPYITAQQAALLHEEFTRDRLQMCTSAGAFDVQLWCSPDTSHRFFVDCQRRYGVQLKQQHGNDLGERMSNALKAMLGSYNKIVIIGSDAPVLDMKTIDAAFSELAHREIVLVPAEDGGYVLLGATVQHDDMLKDVPWGSKKVLSSTLDNMKRLNYNVALVGKSWDVDRPEDLERYRRLKHGGSDLT